MRSVAAAGNYQAPDVVALRLRMRPMLGSDHEPAALLLDGYNFWPVGDANTLGGLGEGAFFGESEPGGAANAGQGTSYEDDVITHVIFSLPMRSGFDGAFYKAWLRRTGINSRDQVYAVGAS
jgi:hypothetical protein